MECLLPYVLMYGDCTSYNGWIRENDRGVELERFHCNILGVNTFGYDT